MIDELDIVKTLVAKPLVPIGKIGTVVYLHSDGKGCEVEFSYSDSNLSNEVVTYELSEVEKI